MANASYVSLTRQHALETELQVIAGNLANMNTAGYRRGSVIFSEFVKAVDGDVGSLSMTAARARYSDMTQGALTRTGSPFDLAVEGEGFFLVETPAGQRLTRSGSFSPTPENELATAEGWRLLDDAGAPVFLPPDAGEVMISPDGTLSVDGQLLARVGVVTVDEGEAMRREGGTLFVPEGPIRPMDDARVAQGFLEDSNVSPVEELTRMIEVQRAYELTQNLMTIEDDRMRRMVETLGRNV